NLASTLKMNILDREALILQIFERRAKSSESTLQVKMAQLRYEMSRAKEKVRLAKMGEQPGFMGIGKFEVDVYFNDIKNRMNGVKSKLAKSSTQRALHRKTRKSKPFHYTFYNHTKDHSKKFRGFNFRYGRFHKQTTRIHGPSVQVNS